jgi:hypothetical protein
MIRNETGQIKFILFDSVIKSKNVNIINNFFIKEGII